VEPEVITLSSDSSQDGEALKAPEGEALKVPVLKLKLPLGNLENKR
jgi:hypothetical protein